MTSAHDAGLTPKDVIVAGHRGDPGDLDMVRTGIGHPDAAVRTAALGALERLGALEPADLAVALRDPAVAVRRRAAELAAGHPGVDLGHALHDPDPRVVEVAAWACGEHETVADDVVTALIELAGDADDALVREAAVAALGAIGDERGLPAIIAATSDKPAVRRRAVLALAPFDGPDVEAAIDRALDDRDWQVRQSAEVLRRAARP